MPLARLFVGDKIRLTEFKKDDLPIMTHWYRYSDLIRMYDGTPAYPRTQEYWEAWFGELPNQKDGYTFAIRPNDDDKLIGIITLDGILWNLGVGSIGIAIGDPGNQGKGYGSEAMQLLLKFAFHELNLHRVQLTVFSYNERAMRLYEHLGFVKEGVHREHLYRDGQRFDMVLYGMLRREWEAAQNTAP